MTTTLEETKTKFKDIVFTHIQREGIDELMDYLENSDFYESPASTKFHGSYPGGLCEHSINVYEMLVNEVHNTFGENWAEVVSPESVAIVSLFHDLCKVNTYESYFRNVKNEDTGIWEKVECYRRNPLFPLGHGEKSLFILMNYMLLTAQEALAIRWHMGAFDIGNYNNVNELDQAFKQSNIAFLLHVADMKANYLIESREY